MGKVLIQIGLEVYQLVFLSGMGTTDHCLDSYNFWIVCEYPAGGFAPRKILFDYSRYFNNAIPVSECHS